MMDAPKFGFSDLGDFKPKAKKAKKQKIPEKELDAVADKLGFTGREEPIRRKKRSFSNKPIEQFNLRAYVEDINKFVEYADKTGKPYKTIFSELVNKL